MDAQHDKPRPADMPAPISDSAAFKSVCEGSRLVICDRPIEVLLEMMRVGADTEPGVDAEELCRAIVLLKFAAEDPGRFEAQMQNLRQETPKVLAVIIKVSDLMAELTERVEAAILPVIAAKRKELILKHLLDDVMGCPEEGPDKAS